MGVSQLFDKAKQAGIKRGDLVLVALLLVLSVIMMCLTLTGGSTGAVARICVDGQEVAQLPLDIDVTYEIPGGMGNVVEISGGQVRMLRADCPDASCVAQGFISRTGQCIVCLPARVTVTVVSARNSDGLDAVAY